MYVVTTIVEKSEFYRSRDFCHYSGGKLQKKKFKFDHYVAIFTMAFFL